MSRYSKTESVRTRAYNQTNKRKNIIKYNTTYYQNIPERNSDILLITQEGDRLDNLATQFYGDPNLWWFIAKANNLKVMNVPAGTSIRVPVDTSEAFGD